MIKALKFFDPLPALILEGRKNITWRVDDDKDLSVGDELSLCRINGSEFARAKIISVKRTTFGELTREDKDGHEKFSSDKEMYDTYSHSYNIQIKPSTEVKVVKFKLFK